MNELLCVSCLFILGCGPQFVFIEGTEPKVWIVNDAVANSCFAKNQADYTRELGLNTDHVNVMLTNEIKPIAAYDKYRIFINDKAPNQLSAYGHELVRHHCLISGDCSWYASDYPTWDGYIGELWNKAETLSLHYCPNEGPHV